MLEPTSLAHADTLSRAHDRRGAEDAPVLDDLPDLLLVERARAKDTSAFEALMRRYSRRLFRIARSILGTESHAAEAAQAAYVHAFADLDRCEPTGKFAAWLTRLAFDEAQARRRRLSLQGVSGRTEVIPAVALAANDVSPPFEPRPTRESLERAVDALPEVFRTVVVLRLIEGLTGVEVAVCLGLNETTVRTRLFRGQRRLKGEVTQQIRANPQRLFELTSACSDHIIEQVLVQLRAASTASGLK